LEIVIGESARNIAAHSRCGLLLLQASDFRHPLVGWQAQQVTRPDDRVTASWRNALARLAARVRVPSFVVQSPEWSCVWSRR
jgi:hypothetical protein